MSFSGGKENVTYKKSYAFAIKVVEVYKTIHAKNEFVLSRQLLKSGTSIGANIAEANGAISTADFSAKISIAYKESLETKYWLSLLKDTNYISLDTFAALHNDCDEISKILFSILKTTRIKPNSEKSQ
jgi:four helix bundle protein